jgi:hypothetical protein
MCNNMLLLLLLLLSLSLSLTLLLLYDGDDCAFVKSVVWRTLLWILTLLRFQHVVSRIGKLENIDRTYFLITATDFYHNQVRFKSKTTKN